MLKQTGTQGFKETPLKYCNVWMALNNGMIFKFDYTPLVEKLDLVPHAKSRSNYNSHRIFPNEDFAKQQKSVKFKTMILNEEIIENDDVENLVIFRDFEFEAHKEP